MDLEEKDHEKDPFGLYEHQFMENEAKFDLKEDQIETQSNYGILSLECKMFGNFDVSQFLKNPSKLQSNDHDPIECLWERQSTSASLMDIEPQEES